MSYAYAYVQNTTVLEVERRTLQDTSDYPIGKYYHGALLPFFVEIRPGDNAPAEEEVRPGWIYRDNVFSQPEPFQINDATGQLYLPPSISAQQFWQVFQENLQMKNQLSQMGSVVNSLLLEQLAAEGAVTI